MLKISMLIFFLPFWTCLTTVKITSPPYIEVMASTTAHEVELPCHYTSSSGTNCTINWIKRLAIAPPVLQVTQTGIALPAGDYISRVSLGNNASLVLQKPTVADTSNYTCKITNFRDTEVQDSAVIYLFVAVPPTIENTPARKIQFHWPKGFVLSCFGYGLPTPNVSWSKDNHLLDNTGTTLVVKHGGPNDSGEYTCMLSNVVGNVSAVFEVEFCEFVRVQNGWVTYIIIFSIPTVGIIFIGRTLKCLLKSSLLTGMTVTAKLMAGCIMVGLYLGSLNLIISFLVECRPYSSGLYFVEVGAGLIFLILLILVIGFGMLLVFAEIYCVKLGPGRQCLIYLILFCGFGFILLFQVSNHPDNQH